MEAADLSALTAAARAFARRVVAPLVGTEGRDGDLARLPEALAEADRAGLVANASPEAPGHSWGIWGAALEGDGPAPSLAMLEELALACAGFAAALHAAGLGARESGGLAAEPSRAAVALLEEGALAAPPIGPGRWPPLGSRLEGPAGGRSLTGAKPFVYAAPGTTALVVFASSADGLVARVRLATSAERLGRVDAGPRMGLAACEVHHLSFDRVEVAEQDVLAPADSGGYLARFWLGLAAIALGNARGALEIATRYAHERRQGGRLIARHPAVELLLGGAEARTLACQASLRGALGQPALPLRMAALLKERVTGACAEAVSACLQVLGGYGYMEDYRLEKRLRDALTLRTAGGRPDDLLRLVAATGAEP